MSLHFAAPWAMALAGLSRWSGMRPPPLVMERHATLSGGVADCSATTTSRIWAPSATTHVAAQGQLTFIARILGKFRRKSPTFKGFRLAQLGSFNDAGVLRPSGSSTWASAGSPRSAPSRITATRSAFSNESIDSSRMIWRDRHGSLATEQLRRWLEAWVGLPVGALFCLIAGVTLGRAWAPAAVRAHPRRLAAGAGVHRRSGTPTSA